MSEPAAPLSGGRRRLSPDSKTGGACEGIAARRSSLAERRTLIPGRRRPSIPAGRVSVPMESRGRAWGVSPGLSGEAEPANPSSVTPSVGSDGRRQGRAGSEGQRTALISAFFSSDQQAVRLARRPEATRSRPDEPERGCRLAGDGRRSWRGRASVSDGIAWESRNGAPAEKGSPRRPKPPHPSSVSSTSVGSDGRRQGREGSRRVAGAADRADFSLPQFRISRRSV